MMKHRTSTSRMATAPAAAGRIGRHDAPGKGRTAAGTVTVITAAILLVLASMQAQAQQRSFDVPAGPARQSIPEFARQADLQIVAPGGNWSSRRTLAVTGTHDARAALSRLLDGTGLSVVRDDGRTITLASAGNPTGARAPAMPSGAEQADTPPGPEQAADTPPPAPRATPASNRSNDATAQDIDAVIVVGTYLPRTDSETALPVTALSRTDIELSGVNTASEFLSQLPQSAEFDNSETATGPNDARGDAASVNLRGLGSGNTLVLLNGRRIAPHPISAGEVPRLSTNINQIPLGAVQSIEVLRDGASALYGSDAVAGVVNTTLRRNFTGLETSLRYGDVTDGHLGEVSASALLGVDLNGGRSNWMAFASVYDRGSLTGAERDLTADLRARAGSDATQWNNTSVSGPYGQFTTGTANPDGSFTTRRPPGGPTNGRFYTLPTSTGTGVAFGALPTDLRYDFSPEFVLVPETRRVQFFSAFNHDFDNGIQGYLEAFLYRADSTMSNATAPISANADNNIHVPASNYYNPFGSRFYGPGTANPGTAPFDVLIRNYRPVEVGPRIAEVESRSHQLVGGLRGTALDWDWDIGLSHGTGRTEDTGRNMISESRLRQQLALDTPDAFNVFGGPGANTQAALDAVRIDTRREGEAGLTTLDGKLRRELFSMPGGPAQMAMGVEYRHESFKDRRDERSRADDVIAQSISSDAGGSRNVQSGFVEFALPFFSQQNALPGLSRLELSLAGRVERYSDFGTAAKPKLGLSWSPVDWLTLRASYNEGFRAPTLAQVFVGEIIRRSTGEPDPYRANVTATQADLGIESRQIIRGGNADLGPEESTARNVGLVLDVPFVQGLSFTADYFRIRQSDVIDTFGESDQLALDFLLRTTGQGFNPNVVRLAVTAADQAAFDAYNAANPSAPRTAVGAVDFVRDTFVNISRREVSGVDLGMRYRSPESDLGRFTLRMDMSRLNRFEQRRDADSPVVSQIGVNGLPRTRGVASLHWRRNTLEAGLQANYVSSFEDTSAPRNADGSLYQVDSWTTYNAFFGVRFEGEGWLGGTSFRVGANNITDRAPPLADDDRGFNEGVHDPRGRFVYAEVRKVW